MARRRWWGLVVGAALALPLLTVPAAQGAADGVYLVTLRDGVTPRDAVVETANALTSEHGGEVRQTWRDALHGFSATLTAGAAAKLAADPSVLTVEADQPVRATQTQPNPPSWGLDRVDQRLRPLNNTYTYPNNASPTWTYVIDTGIDPNHPDFRAPDGINRAWVGFDAFGGNGIDCNGHGTHVAGTIGGYSYGVAKRTFLVGVRVLNCGGGGTIESVVSGVNWVTANAQRPASANMSLGGGFSATLNNAVASSIASGITYTVAAGNENQNACNVSPASVATAITVGATDANDSRATGFSNWGSCVDVFAPGVNITSAWPGGGSNTISGTSMAAPHVAGVVAMYLVWYTGATPAQVSSVITSTATPNVVSNVNGSPNRLLYNAGFSNPTPNNPPQGAVEGANRYGTIRGWARDPDGVANPCVVMFFIGGPMGTGTQIGQATANLPRGSSNDGFAFVLPDHLRDGQPRSVWVHAVEGNAGQTAPLGGSPITVTAHRPRADADFDGDRRTDVSVFRPSTGDWWVRPSTVTHFGQSGDLPVSGDFDGDGRSDPAVFRPSDGSWYVQRSQAGYLQVPFGMSGDVPVAADYTGDGRADLAVFRPSDGTWYVWPTDGSAWFGLPFGISTDRPVPGDHDADGRADAAVFRPSTGTWIVWRSSDQRVTYEQWGVASDVLVAADYDGDGATDPAVFRPSEGTWYLRLSLTRSTRVVQWGLGTDVPVAGDHDGDGRADLATFRAGSNGQWSILRSGGGEEYHSFGQVGDIPVPGMPR
ncbi:MAG TPA: S8 family serine peptidase [Pseudonocardiaceae bacterium]